jgi:outer membrane lipoprotein
MRWLLVGLGLLLAGCASAFPDEVMRTVDRSITVDELRRDPAGHKGARVIVGGEILSTQPRQGQTEIEMLARRLRDGGSPERSDRSPGRVLLRTADFLDPAIYAAGRRITVVGTVNGAEERKVGELPYRYPVIDVERIRLWSQDVVLGPPYYPAPYYYWPYGPYYLAPYGGFYGPGFWW